MTTPNDSALVKVANWLTNAAEKGDEAAKKALATLYRMNMGR